MLNLVRDIRKTTIDGLCDGLNQSRSFAMQAAFFWIENKHISLASGINLNVYFLPVVRYVLERVDPPTYLDDFFVSITDVLQQDIVAPSETTSDFKELSEKKRSEEAERLVAIADEVLRNLGASADDDGAHRGT